MRLFDESDEEIFILLT